MVEAINHFLLSVGDLLFGWMLYLPSDLVLFLLALLSALILVLLHRWLADDDLVRRTFNDKKRLRQLIREARQRKDRTTLKRLKQTKAMVSLKSSKQDIKPILIGLIPLIILGTWAFFRVEYHPPQPGEQIQIVLHAPASAVGDVAHLVPQDGLTLLPGDNWVRAIQPVTDNAIKGGEASWVIAADPSEEPYQLLFRYRDQTFEHELLVGQPIYAPALKTHGPEATFSTRMHLRPVKLFGLVPGIPQLVFPPWIVAYIILVVPMAFGLKRLLRPR